ncbi:MAG: ribonuclease PH, partial [Pelagibacteraceae bacterium]|nr:ribonuclease PH [Pelagibacteraceae bacterium]
MLRQNRTFQELRPISFKIGVNIHAEGSCLVKFGNTHVLCTASIDEKTPHWLKNSGKGWVTAEYGMLPRSTNTRVDREATKGKQSGRTQEIQRLIGRSLRSVINLENLGERQIKIDCDVIQADGGTRTASISGGFVALYQAVLLLQKEYNIQKPIVKEFVAAVSAGIIADQPNLDLDYNEDSLAQVDANFIICESGKIAEIQVTGEEYFFSDSQ